MRQMSFLTPPRFTTHLLRSALLGVSCLLAPLSLVSAREVPITHITRAPVVAVLNMSGPSLDVWLERAERALQEDVARVKRGEAHRKAIQWRLDQNNLPRTPQALKLAPLSVEDLSELQREAFVQIPQIQTITSDELSRLLPPTVKAEAHSEQEALERGKMLGADWVLTSSATPMGPVLKVEWHLYEVRLATQIARHFVWSQDPKQLQAELPSISKLIYQHGLNTLEARKRKAREVVRARLHQEALEQFLDKNPIRIDERTGLVKESLITGKAVELPPESPLGGAEVGGAEAGGAEVGGAEAGGAEAGGTEGGPKLTWSERAQLEALKAQKEMDEVQRQLDAAYEQRRTQEEQKREVLEAEAEQAWAEIQSLIGPSPSKATLKAQGGVWRWSDVTLAMKSELPLSKQQAMLKTFINNYKNLERFAQQVHEARERQTWLPSKPDFITVRQGRFLIGSANAFRDEWPRQWVEIKAFLGGLTEVTNAHYKACVDAGACTPPHWDDNRCHIFKGNQLSGHSLQNGPLPAVGRRGDLPVVCVTWQQANSYAAWANARLLSEAEWEFVARSGDRTYLYPWGREEPSCEYAVMTIPIRMDRFDAKRFQTGCGFSTFLPVCSRPKGVNSYGMCDLAGNVWEWVTDTYRPSHERVPPDGSPVRGAGLKVIRGGGFASSARELRASTRGQRVAGEPASYIGFRVARDFE